LERRTGEVGLVENSGEGSSSPLQTLTYYGQTLLRYQAVDGILLGNYN